jgi:hypothetical protein
MYYYIDTTSRVQSEALDIVNLINKTQKLIGLLVSPHNCGTFRPLNGINGWKLSANHADAP